ncbi:MAG: hypothetical protein AB7V27_17760 [Candidatus Binatia bacterium]
MAEGGGGADAGARFYRGIIERLFTGAGIGVVRANSGREIPFTAAHVVITGAARHFHDLREGLAVGFDVSWTSKGLRVSVLYISPPSEADPGRMGD